MPMSLDFVCHRASVFDRISDYFFTKIGLAMLFNITNIITRCKKISLFLFDILSANLLIISIFLVGNKVFAIV